jgi:hypothetical protein
LELGLQLEADRLVNLETTGNQNLKVAANLKRLRRNTTTEQRKPK